MSASAELVCVPPENIPQIWPVAEHLIHKALDRNGAADFRNVMDSVYAGESLLWLVWDGSKILCAAVTQLLVANHEKSCLIIACGGSGWNKFGHLLQGIEKFAKAEGCLRVRIIGRKGWAKVLPDYQITRYVLDKEIF